MPVSSLNVDLSLNTAAFNRGIRNAERAMAQAAGNFERIGNSLALGITAPLAGIGIAAIKASGDFEKLQKGLEATMTGAGYTINQVTQELDALREAAKAPGLDFEQAVKGSLRLQGVGLSAEQARNILEQFGNAVAATGGDASQLDRVTVQLAQIIGKGKILNEDLAILKENLPSISKTLVDAFGTADAEGLRKLNISTKDFVNTITKELANTPRVVGGLSNSIVNAQVAIQQAAAKLGDTLNKTFNISGNLNKFSEWIVGVADRWAQLDEGTQRVIIGIGVFAAAIGPAIRAGGLLVNAVSTSIVEFRKFQKAFIGVSEGANIAQKAWAALNATAKLSVIGIAIGVIAAAAAAFLLLSKNTNLAAQAQKEVAATQLQAAQSTGEQRVKVELLSKVLTDNTKALGERKAALKELQAISPQYFGALDVEKSKVDDVTRAVSLYTESITKAAFAQAAFQKISQDAARQIELEIQLQEKRKALSGLGITQGLAVAPLQSQISAIQQELAAIGERRKAYQAVIDQNGGVVKAIENTTTTTNTNTDATSGNTKALKDYGDQLERDVELLLQMNEQQAKATLGEIKRFGDTNQDFAPLPLPAFSGGDNEAVSMQALSYDNLTVSMKAYTDQITLASEQMDVWAKKQMQEQQRVSLTNDVYGALGQTIIELGTATSSALSQSGNAWKNYARNAMGAIADLIGEIVRLYVAQIIEKTAKQTSALGVFAIPISIAAGALASGAIKAALNAVKLAKGGLAYGPTFAVVGDNPGAKSNPEVIAPLDKLKGIIGETGVGGRVEVFGTIKGQDIYISNERAGRDKGRIR